MGSTLHITNGDSIAAGVRTADPFGEIVPWRDILHEGPVPAGLSFSELSRVRADFLAAEEFGDAEDLLKNFRERDDALRRFGDHDEVVLWLEWDLYDQLQLLQILDFFATHAPEDIGDNATRLSLVSLDGYLGNLAQDRFPELYRSRIEVTRAMLELARDGWAAFRSSDPKDLESFIDSDTSALPFLAGALRRLLEDLPSARNGLSRSECQLLEAVAQRPLRFADIFRRTADREERMYCGDATMARYIQRMSRHPHPLMTYPTGETIDAPRTEEDSSAFRNAEIALTETGRNVLAGDRDWIELGGTDRWLGGVHLNGRETPWRWDDEHGRVVDAGNRINGDRS